MDLVLGEAGGSVILDFKTAARADELSELTHEIQLGCYAYLFRQSTGTTESALEIRRLIKTKVPQILFHRWPARTERHFQRLFAWSGPISTICTRLALSFDLGTPAATAIFVSDTAASGQGKHSS